MNKTKIYQIFDYPDKGMIYGKFKGKYPSQAAKKIFSKLAHEQNFTNANSKKALVFSIYNKADKKELKYIGTRILLVVPTVVKINGKSITYKYKNIVTKYKDYFNE
jgi:hypothetical protein